MELIGLIGGALIVTSYIPQIVKSYRTKQVGDLSLLMILATFVGTVLWVIYGVMHKSISIVLTNSIFLVFVIFQLCLMLIYDGKVEK